MSFPADSQQMTSVAVTAHEVSDSETRRPSTLYHYTDAAGLIGILKPSSWDIGVWPELEKQLAGAAQLRASDVRYMNDSEELKFGARYFVDRLRQAAIDPMLSRDVRQACANLAAFFSQEDVFDWYLRCFATCFCEKGDLLSQWRGYAGGTGGFAIGFSWDALTQRSRVLAPTRLGPLITADEAKVQPVKYGPAATQAAADRFIEQMREPDETIALMLTGRGHGLEWLTTHALRDILSVKDDGFEEELEWRLYYMAGDQYGTPKIRLGRPGLVPYLNVAVNMKKVDEMTILPPALNQLVVGPGHNQRSQIAAARQLLRGCGYDPDIVVPSRISFTG